MQYNIDHESNRDNAADGRRRGARINDHFQNACARATRANWFNTDDLCLLSALRGRVVVARAFQVLCTELDWAGIPQAQRIYEDLRNPRMWLVIA